MSAKRFFTLFSLLTATAFSSLANDSISMIPQIHGVVRARYELSTAHGQQRFQVRNARVNIGGQITRMFNYYVQADLCDRGKMKILDAWGRVNFDPQFGVQLGQFRMPFGVESFLAPGNYIFSNRSYMGKQMCNFRAVGAKFIVAPKSIPLTFEAGAFNPNTISDHTSWHKPMAYSVKLSYRLKNVSLATGVMSIVPDSVRANLADFAVTWSAGRWMLAGEYMFEHYTCSPSTPDAHSYVVNAVYSMPVKLWQFNRLSFQGRFDGITAHSSGKRDADGNLAIDTPARNRITLGTTLSYIRTAKLGVDIRADYEKMFFHRGTRTDADMADKLCLELIMRF